MIKTGRLVPAAGIPAIPEFALKVASAWRCAISVHSGWGTPESFVLRDLTKIVSTSDFQSEVGEVFGEIGGELPAKFGGRFSSFVCWGIVRSIFHQNSNANFTIRLHYEVLGCGGP